MKTPQRSRRGISLIEALVAMAVMAFGMLGVVGMQATLRANADAAKQRSEAVRIAQETLEQWRRFSVLKNTDDDATSEHPAADFPFTYTNIAPIAASTVTGYDLTNTTYTRTGTIEAGTLPGQKTLKVSVSWQDRNGATQTIRLYSVVSKVAPELTGTFAAPPSGGIAHAPGGRHRGIPPQAKNFGDGTSGFRPPGNPTGVAWLFNNTTGVMQLCSTAVADNASLTLASDLTSCSTSTAYLLISGFVRFNTGSSQPTALDVTDPNTAVPAYGSGLQVQVNQTAPAAFASPPARTCFQGFASNYIQYFCAIPAKDLTATPPSSTPPRWSGSLELTSSMLTIAPPPGSSAIASTQGKVCRYRSAATYSNQNVPLVNENLLVMPAGNNTIAFTCTIGTPQITWPHQPAT
jgi:Tfp pilus assembly protein PilV